MLVSGAGAAWSRHFLPGAGAAFFLEPEWAPRTQTSGAGAAQKSGCSATLLFREYKRITLQLLLPYSDFNLEGGIIKLKSTAF